MNDKHCIKFSHEFQWRPAPYCFAIGKDETTFVSGHFCGDIKAGCLETGEVIYHIRKAHNTKWIRSVALNLDLELFISGGEDKKIKLWNLNNGKQIHCLSCSSAVRSICIDNTGMLLISGHEDGMINVWDLDKRELFFSLKGHVKSVEQLIITEDLATLFTGSEDGSIKIWDLWSENEIKNINTPNYVYSLCLSKKHNTIISGGEYEEDFYCWNIEVGNILQTFIGHSDSIIHIVNIADQDLIISASLDRTVRLWNIKTRKQVLLLHSEFYGVPILTTSPNKNTIMVGSTDGLIRVWKSLQQESNH